VVLFGLLVGVVKKERLKCYTDKRERELQKRQVETEVYKESEGEGEESGGREIEKVKG
jgi:hypothetical protein